MSFFDELKRRNVIRVGIAYVVTAWVLAQVAEFAFDTFDAPDWVLKAVVVVLALGLPLVLLFAWAFELTPEGLVREKHVDRSRSITAQTGRKLDRTIILVLLAAVVWFAWDKFGGTGDTAAPAAVEATETAERPAIGAAPPNEKSVAVLPFVAMSSGPDDEYFADGLTEEILNSLAQLPELLVTARTSAFSFKGQDIPIQEIAAALGVRHVVEGSVRRSGDRMRVTAQLIRAEDGFHLWSENYDSSSADAISVQENIAEKIAVALDIVLDERRREIMRQAGLRDVEAFTLYQKGLDLYERAHGDIPMIAGLRQANEYFEQVMQRVPEYAQVYADHSDLYIHMLNNATGGAVDADVTEEDLASAYPAAIADYEAATRFARTDSARNLAELDLAFLSGNWRGLGGRIERAIANTGCQDGNWLPPVAHVAGYADRYLAYSMAVLTCDPLRSLSWFNTARTALWAGDKEEALRLAREGTEIAPGAWLTMALVRTLVANARYDEAATEIEKRVQDRGMANVLQILIAAHEGDRGRYEELLEGYLQNRGSPNFWDAIVYAWGGHRAEAGRRAAEIDAQAFGPILLWQITHWCTCGAPWDLEATPNFAARIRAGNITWPPASPLTFPLKDW